MANQSKQVRDLLDDLNFCKVTDFKDVRIDARPIYKGALKVFGELLEVYVHIPAWNMSLRPKIFIAGKAREFVAYKDPHIELEAFSSFGKEGAPLLCLGDSTLKLDPIRPAASLKRCFERATELLEKYVKGVLDHDPGEEFFSYWRPKEFIVAEFDYEAILNKKEGYVYIRNGISILRLKNKRDIDGQFSNKFIIYRIKGKAIPHHSVWPIENLQDMENWLSSISNKQVARQFINDFSSNVEWLRFFLFDNGCFGLRIQPSLVQILKEKRAHKDVNFIKQHKNSFLIEKLSVQEGSLNHITGRNLEGIVQGLNDKNILVIGCGAIGGYLIQTLAQAGAGNGGKLYLCDFDELSPGNLGRHILGRDKLGMNKAEAMKEFLENSYVGIDVVSDDMSIKADPEELNNYNLDIIINATGDQGLSEWLNEYSYQNLNSVRILHGWIEGNGIAVCSLYVTYGNGACYRCLDVDWHQNKIKILKEDPKLVPMRACGDGPHSPYIATAALQAAAMLGEHVIDVVNGVETRKFRCLTLDQRKGMVLLDKNHKQDKRCPVCYG